MLDDTYTPVMSETCIATLLRVVGTAGPLAGRVVSWPEDEDELTFGRESSNSIEVPDLTASRRHCRLLRSENRVLLEDLDSANGTILNGRAIRGCVAVSSGDEISFGDSRFQLEEVGRSSVACSVGARVQDSNLELVETVRIDICAESDLAANEIASTETLSGLRFLIQAAEAISDANSLPELAQVVADACLEALPADRVSLVLDDATVPLSWGWNRTDARAPVSVSRTVLSIVRRDPSGILCNDVRVHVTLGASHSLAEQQVAALVAVPLLARRRSLGVLYADRQCRGEKFSEHHAKWILALGRTAALAVEGLRHREQLERENRLLRSELRRGSALVGSSNTMRVLYEQVARAGMTDSTVLLLGETGSGKEMIAKALHAASRRSDRPWLAVNCASFSENLLESELCGHERGAFTGAVAQKKGKLELAHGSTLFLDEVGELAVPVQARLLRVLEERVIERVGGTRTIPVDVRIIAATNQDLRSLVATGRFRSDLYHRLNVICLKIPPLREHAEDIPALAAHFLEELAARAGRRVRGISQEGLSLLMAYDWPGNVRELRNTIEHALGMGSDEWIMPENLKEELRDQMAVSTTVGEDNGYHGRVLRAKRAIVREAFERAEYKHGEAAKTLGLHPNNLHRLVRNLKLEEECR